MAWCVRTIQHFSDVRSVCEKKEKKGARGGDTHGDPIYPGGHNYLYIHTITSWISKSLIYYHLLKEEGAQVDTSKSPTKVPVSQKGIILSLDAYFMVIGLILGW